MCPHSSLKINRYFFLGLIRSSVLKFTGNFNSWFCLREEARSGSWQSFLLAHTWGKPATGPWSHDPGGSSPSQQHSAEGDPACDQPAFCARTYSAVADVTDGMGNGVIAITNGKNPWQYCLVTFLEETPRARLREASSLVKCSAAPISRAGPELSHW